MSGQRASSRTAGYRTAMIVSGIICRLLSQAAVMPAFIPRRPVLQECLVQPVAGSETGSGGAGLVSKNLGTYLARLTPARPFAWLPRETGWTQSEVHKASWMYGKQVAKSWRSNKRHRGGEAGSSAGTSQAPICAGLTKSERRRKMLSSYDHARKSNTHSRLFRPAQSRAIIHNPFFFTCPSTCASGA